MSSDRDSDPFKPPAIPTTVGCIHCGREYESYLIEYRVETKEDGSRQGFWCCPTPGCDGMGFGFDILPTDPDYQDENGSWVHDEDEDAAPESNGFHDGGGPDLPPDGDDGNEDIPF